MNSETEIRRKNKKLVLNYWEHFSINVPLFFFKKLCFNCRIWMIEAKEAFF